MAIVTVGCKGPHIGRGHPQPNKFQSIPQLILLAARQGFRGGAVVTSEKYKKQVGENGGHRQYHRA